MVYRLVTLKYTLQAPTMYIPYILIPSPLLQPILPAVAVCYVCSLDGHMQSPWEKKIKEDAPSTLMECKICQKVCHPNCLEASVGVQCIFKQEGVLYY